MLRARCSRIVCGTKMTRPISIFIALAFAAACSRPHLHAEDESSYRKFAISGAPDICVSKEVDSSEIRGSLGVGSLVHGVRIDYVIADLGVDIEVQIRSVRQPSPSDQRPISNGEAVKINQLGLWRQDGERGDLWFSSSRDMEPSGFLVVCRNIPGNRCSGAIRHDRFEGSYAFSREDLRYWKQIEESVESLLEDAIKLCP